MSAVSAAVAARIISTGPTGATLLTIVKMQQHACSVLVLLLALALVLMAQTAAPGEALHGLFARTWEWELEQSPLTASTLGDRRWNDRWDDVSPEAMRTRQAHRESVLEELAAIPRDRLSTADRTHYDVFEHQYRTMVEGFGHRYHLIRTNTYDGVQNIEQIADSLRFQTVKDYEDWLARLERFPAFLAQNITLMREGIAGNVLLPKVIMRRIRGQVETIATQPPQASGFFAPFRDFPASFTDADRVRLAQAGRKAVESHVQPAFARFGDFLDREYIPTAYDQVGWWQTSSGGDGYTFLARAYTTTDLTPRQIHDLGLTEVARIRAAMEHIKGETGFEGALSEFFTFLRTDPQFFHETGPELLEAYRALAKRVDPELVKVIGRLPRLPYGVQPIPETIAPNTTTAYASYGAPDGSRPAYFFVNLYKPETRPTWEMLALTLHEAVPGHCLQGSIAQELDLPEFRKHAGFTAYVEGWALYAESLGEDMALYDDDPYARFGRLTYEMWRAVRLVVDTGIHALRWDRDKAIGYFMENAAKTEQDVTNEIDRYISWPGQALAYKVGELDIRELRRKAERTLGDRFDLRAFNDVVLATGAVPLHILEQEVNAWIAARAE